MWSTGLGQGTQWCWMVAIWVNSKQHKNHESALTIQVTHSALELGLLESSTQAARLCLPKCLQNATNQSL